MALLVMPAAGSCLRAPASLVASGTSVGPIAISKPVGQGQLARNLPDDVATVQEALNQVTLKGAAGGPMPFLAIDGLYGPKTRAAIGQFQQVQLQIFDELVEPGKNTIIRLNEIVDPISKEELQARVGGALPLVLQALAAAVANLRTVITSGPATSGPAAVAADRLNRHFRLNTLSSSQQSEARVVLFESFFEFSLVIARPDLFGFAGLDAFDLAKNLPKKALVNSFGAFAPDKDEKGKANPARRIRLGLGFFAKDVTSEFAAFIILHELAHFCSRRDGIEIIDSGRGWFDDIFIKPLTAKKRLANADSFATFAQECRTGSQSKPVFVTTSPGGLGGAR